jgi:hypothetical protein
VRTNTLPQHPRPSNQRACHGIQRNRPNHDSHLVLICFRNLYDFNRLVVIGNFNEQYLTTRLQFNGAVNLNSNSIRTSRRRVAHSAYPASLFLEHFAVSFVIDAKHFFGIKSTWEWPHLISLALTSNLLMPGEEPRKVEALFQAAARAAIRMPLLQTMQIWNRRKGLAALIKYQKSYETRKATIIRNGTWKMTLTPKVMKAWEAVVNQHDDWSLDLVQEELDEAAIESHADAIHHLGLSGIVIRPVLLQQIWIEQRALKGTPTV